VAVITAADDCSRFSDTPPKKTKTQHNCSLLRACLFRALLGAGSVAAIQPSRRSLG